MAYNYKYPRPSVTADCIVITKDSQSKVLLVKRRNEPFKDYWAFPGGYMNIRRMAHFAGYFFVSDVQ